MNDTGLPLKSSCEDREHFNCFKNIWSAHYFVGNILGLWFIMMNSVQTSYLKKKKKGFIMLPCLGSPRGGIKLLSWLSFLTSLFSSLINLFLTYSLMQSLYTLQQEYFHCSWKRLHRLSGREWRKVQVKHGERGAWEELEIWSQVLICRWLTMIAFEGTSS